jgi:hypothetical protein
MMIEIMSRFLALTAVFLLTTATFAAAQNSADPSTGISLDELGFPKSQEQGSAQDQALLDKRSEMLKIHQWLGLINVGPMLATLYTAPGQHASQASINLHAGLGVTTVGLYAATAYFAIFAPKPAGTVDKGPIRVHKGLAWVHGIGFIITPILGGIAYDQRSAGERVHGIAKYHGTAAGITALAYGGAILAVTVKF